MTTSKQNEKPVSLDSFKIDFRRAGNMAKYRNSKYKYHKLQYDLLVNNTDLFKKPLSQTVVDRLKSG